MNIFTKSLITGVFTVGLVGCATQPGDPGISQAQGGALLGGVLGGVLGSSISDQNPAATIGGTLLGAYIGHRVGRSMDETARLKADRASYRAFDTGQRQNWAYKEASGSVYPGQTYYQNGRECRRFTSHATIDGHRQVLHGVACKRDGRWYIVG